MNLSHMPQNLHVKTLNTPGKRRLQINIINTKTRIDNKKQRMKQLQLKGKIAHSKLSPIHKRAILHVNTLYTDISCF